MTLARRVMAVETSLSPTELVLRWLDEAHAYGDFASYVRSELAASAAEGPLDRLAREAATGVRARLRGKRPEVIDTAVRSALRETVFRVELVVRITVTTADLLEREALLDAALAADIALLTGDDGRDPTYLGRLARLRDALALRVRELDAMAEARTTVERRYLDGHAALFPDAVTSWAEQVRSTAILVDLATCLAECDGVPAAEPTDPDAVTDRAAELVADLVEPARSTALAKLGEGARALGIATNWLRARSVTPPSARSSPSISSETRGQPS